MARRIIQCVWCGRDRPHKARGLCCACHSRAGKKGILDRFQGPGRGAKNWTPQPPRGDLPALPEAPPPPPLPAAAAAPGVLTLTLRFAARDADLHRRLLAEAEAARRTPEQQALYYLETYLTEGRDA